LGEGAKQALLLGEGAKQALLLGEGAKQALLLGEGGTMGENLSKKCHALLKVLTELQFCL
jgi:hypothetical protein